MPTNGREWRERRVVGVEKQLPSGMTAVLRPVSFQAFLHMPVPNTLTPLVHNLVNGRQITSPTDPDSTVKYFQLVAAICKYCFVNPRIVDDPQADDEISISDVPDEDAGAVLSIVGLTARQLESFRFGQVADVESVSTEPADESVTVEVTEGAPA